MEPQTAAVNTDTDIYSESVRVESKVFYVDLKENQRGRYLKLSEKGTRRPRSTIIVPLAGLGWFVKLFDYYLSPGEGPRISKQLAVENKVFYFSVGDNPRGKYMRITESGVGHAAGRNTLVIPSAGPEDFGWVTFRDSIKRVCAITQEPIEDVQDSVAGSSSLVGPGPAPPMLTLTSTGAPLLSVGLKKFFFDLGENDKGKYLRITEVVRQERSSVVVPAPALSKFQEALDAVLKGTPLVDTAPAGLLV